MGNLLQMFCLCDAVKYWTCAVHFSSKPFCTAPNKVISKSLQVGQVLLTSTVVNLCAVLAPDVGNVLLLSVLQMLVVWAHDFVRV